MSKQEIIKIIKLFAGQANILTIPRVFITLTGDVETALFLSQLLYWSDKTTKSGWIAKSYKEWKEELGLSRRAVDKAVKRLKELNLIETDVKKFNGAPTKYYKIYEDKLLQLIEEIAKNNKHDVDEQENSESKENEEENDVYPPEPSRTEQIHLPTAINFICSSRANPFAQGEQIHLPGAGKSITKITTETTTEITTESVCVHAGTQAGKSDLVKLGDLDDKNSVNDADPNLAIPLEMSFYVERYNNFARQHGLTEVHSVPSWLRELFKRQFCAYRDLFLQFDEILAHLEKTQFFFFNENYYEINFAWIIEHIHEILHFRKINEKSKLYELYNQLSNLLKKYPIVDNYYVVDIEEGKKIFKRYIYPLITQNLVDMSIYKKEEDKFFISKDVLTKNFIKKLIKVTANG